MKKITKIRLLHLKALRYVLEPIFIIELITYLKNDSNKNLMWFKDAKESQGSVSAISFLEAKNANKNGKYIVGNFSKDIEDFLQHTATLHHVVRLEVRYEENEETRMKTLLLDDVHDLQSRLMLLGRENNKTEENVREGTFEKEYFVEVNVKLF